MANRLYGIYKRDLVANAGAIDWDADTIMAILAGQSADYTPNDQTHDFFDDLVGPWGNSGGTAYNSGTALGSKTNTVTDSGGGVWVTRTDAADTTLTTVTAGNACEHVIVYESITNAASSGLIAHMDTGTGLPVTPGGGDILISWNVSGIFDI